MVGEVIDAYAHRKMEKMRINTAELMAMTEDTVVNINKIKQIAADYDLDSSYNSKARLLEFLKQLEENINLMRANVTVLVTECPRNKRDFIKLWKRPKLVKIAENQEKRMTPNKACLLLLRNCLARKKVNSAATTTSLWDQVADLFTRYRKSTCLDCEDIDEDLIPKETGNCYICNDPLCKKCTESISRLLHLKNEEEQAETIGNKLLVAVCSTCRILGLDKVHIAFKDFQTKDIGGNIRAFEKLKMFRDGSSKLPFIRQVVSKDPSQEALNTSMREHDKREEVYMSMVEEEGEDDTDSGETTIRDGNLAEKVETLVDAIAGGELLIQDNRNTGEDPLAGTGARRKNQYQGQFQSQSLSEKLSEIIDIPTISIIYKSLLRFVSDERRELGGVREEDEKALRGCYDLLGLVSGRDPAEWFGHEEGLIASMILNDTDQDAINNSQMSDVTRNLSALAKHQGRGGRTQPMNSTGASMFGPGLDTFIGAHGHMTEEEEDSESQGE